MHYFTIIGQKQTRRSVFRLRVRHLRIPQCSGLKGKYSFKNSVSFHVIYFIPTQVKKTFFHDHIPTCLNCSNTVMMLFSLDFCMWHCLPLPVPLDSILFNSWFSGYVCYNNCSLEPCWFTGMKVRYQRSSRARSFPCVALNVPYSTSLVSFVTTWVKKGTTYWVTLC